MRRLAVFFRSYVYQHMREGEEEENLSAAHLLDRY